MKFSLTKMLLLGIIVVLSVIIGNITTIIRVQFESTENDSVKANENENDQFHKNKLKNQISNSFDDLLWFTQISDIHISIFRDKSRLTDLEDFCEETLDVIRPYVVLASGDLTDAKNIDTLGSQQYEDEWKMYRNTLDKYEVSKKTVWLDVRGNHDNFNVNGPTAKENFFRNYSMQGGNNARSYLHTAYTPSGKGVSFVALDACLEPGPKRPFNFFGVVQERDAEHLQSLIRSVEASSSHSVWFGHYPTSCILSAGQGVRDIIASDLRAQAYLCGHLHTMGGVVPQMYTLQQSGFLELELADWKDNRVYRLAAIDHGLFSFVDVHHKEWPVALITNPKHALFHIPGREPDHDLASSTHIRILAFSLSAIDSVRVKINSEEWQPCEQVKGPLYVKSWNPQQYSHGIHNIQVEVVDKAGRIKLFEQPFSLDGTRMSYQIMARILLMTNASAVFQVAFGLAVFGCVVPLSLLRLLMCRVRSGQRHIPTTNVGFLRDWYRRLWILANIDKFYYALILYPLYIIVGPWAVGEIIEDQIGVIFAWGVFVNGAYLPGSFTYAYGVFQMATFQFPLTLILAYKLDKRLHSRPEPLRKLYYSVLYHWWADLPLYLLTILQLLFLYFFWLSYGSLAVLLGPFRSWPLFTTFLLWRRIRHIPLYSIQEIAEVFKSRSMVRPN